MELIQKILDLDVPYAPKLSPDGKRVVYQTSLKWHHRKGDNNVAPLWLAETGVERSARKLTDGTSNDRMPQWSPDGESIVFISDRAKPGKACALYLWDLRNDISQVKALTPEENEVRLVQFAFSPDGRYIAFVAPPEKSPERKAKEKSKDDAHVWGQDWQFSVLHLLHMEKGTIETISSTDVDVAGFAWSDDSTEVAIVTHRTPDIESADLYGTDISIIKIEDRETHKVCHVPRDASDLTWLNSTLYFRTYNILHENTSGWALYSIDANGGSRDISKVANGVNDCAAGVSKIVDDLIVYVQNGMQDELRLLDGKILLSQKKWIKDFDVVLNKETKDLALIISEGDVNHPTEVFSISPNGERTQLSSHGDGFESDGPSQCTFLECQTLDGKERLDGMFLIPSQRAGSNGKPDQALPTMVFIHGGPYYRMLDAFDSFDPIHLFTPLLLAEGYGILIPNYRGSSGRGERFAGYGSGSYGIHDEPDIVAMTQFSIKQGYADKTKLMAGGWSQGGYLSYLSAVRNGAHGFGWSFKAIIPGAGVTEWDSMSLTSDLGYTQAESAGGGIWTLDKSNLKTRTGSALWEFKNAVDQGRIPHLLILHGEQDPRVPVTQAWGFRRAMDKAG